MMIYVGIDPGKTGAIVGFTGEGERILCVDTPVAQKEYDVGGMVELVRQFGTDAHWAVEQAHAFPRIGARTNFEVGRGFGLWLGILAACRVPHEVVTANRWHKDMTAGISIPKGTKKPSKAKSRIAADRLWPGAYRPQDDGQIDSALIAEWLRRKLH